MEVIGTLNNNDAYKQLNAVKFRCYYCYRYIKLRFYYLKVLFTLKRLKYFIHFLYAIIKTN